MGGIETACLSLDRNDVDKAPRIARRFERLRVNALSEALTVDGLEQTALLAAILALATKTSAPPLHEFMFSDYLVAQHVHTALRDLGATDLREPTCCGSLTYLQVSQSTLTRVGLGHDTGHWSHPELNDAAILRAAVCLDATFTPTALIFPALGSDPTLVRALKTLAAEYELPAPAGRMMIPAAAISPILQRAAMPDAARSYDRLLAGLTSQPLARHEISVLAALAGSRRAQRRARATAAPALFDGTRVAALGDLGRYRLTARQRAAAQALVTDENVNYADIAARLGMSAGAFAQCLRQFWDKADGVTASRALKPRKARRRQAATGTQAAPAAFAACNASRASTAAAAQTERLQGVGDLSQYNLPPDSVAVVQFRQDHPDLTLTQSAAQLGITKDSFSGRLRRALDVIGDNR